MNLTKQEKYNDFRYRLHDFSDAIFSFSIFTGFEASKGHHLAEYHTIPFISCLAIFYLTKVKKELILKTI